MLTDTDRQLGYPQLQKQQMGVEIWSQDFFYQASGDDIIEQVKAQAKQVDVAQTKYTEQLTATKKYRLNVVEGGYCANKYTLKKKRDLCQSQVNKSLEDKEKTLARLAADLSSKKSLLAQLKSKLSADNAAIKTLAAQGKTPDSVIAEATAKAKQSKTILYVGIGLAVVTAGFFIVRAIRK